jgi:hypothetical protein
MRQVGGFAKRFFAVLCCASALLGAIALANLNYGASIEERSTFDSKIELVASVNCGTGCTFVLSPADQKAIAAGGVAAAAAITTRPCRTNVACNALAIAGAAIVTMYVSEHGSDTCDMHIRIRNMGAGTTAVWVDHVTLCGEPLPV